MTKQFNTRGFQDLLGETVLMVDTTKVNVVHIHTASGKVISIDAETPNDGVPILVVGDWSEMLEEKTNG